MNLPPSHLSPSPQCLKKCREETAEALGLDPADLELSMGMSGDFESAVRPHPTSLPPNERRSEQTWGLLVLFIGPAAPFRGIVSF